MSSFSPPPRLVFAFLISEEHPVPAKQEVVLIQWEQTIVCVSVCVSRVAQYRLVQLSVSRVADARRACLPSPILQYARVDADTLNEIKT